MPCQITQERFELMDCSGDLGSVIAKTLPVLAVAPTARVGSAVAALKGKIYLFSGRGGVSMAPIDENGAIWSYSPSESAWSLVSPANPTASYPAARSYHTMTADGEDSIYVHAGCPEKGRLSDLWSFNTETRVWTQLPSAPDPPRGGASLTHSAGKLYRMNGFDGTQEQGGSLDVFDISGKAWSTITYHADGVSGPEPRSVCVLVALKLSGKDFLVTMFGEHDPSSLGHAGAGKMLGDVWVFDIENRKWCRVEAQGEAPAPRGWFDADVESKGGNDHVIVHGGLAEDNSRLGDVWRLEIV